MKKIFSLLLLAVVVAGCTKSENDEVGNNSNYTIRIINPYEGIDFASVTKINAISHEHISNVTRLKKCYDRGIRYFACVHYQPACPPYPLSGWNIPYIDYTNTDDRDYTTTIKYFTGAIKSFVDKDGNTIYTDDLAQIPNAEHPKFAIDKNAETPSIMQHFNVLGNLWGEVGHGIGTDPMAKIHAHPLWDLKDINEMFTSNLLYPGKVFGTINHNDNYSEAKRFLDNCPTIFKAMELFNNGSSMAKNQRHRDLYDRLLTEGYRIWGTSVVDWQDDFRYSEYECDRGCNVLLLPDWDTQTVAQRSEAGLDAYIAGQYYMSGFGNHSITGFSIAQDSVTLTLSDEATSINAITNLGKTKVDNTSSMLFVIPKGAIFLRFEAFFNDDEIHDFIYTNPIWIEHLMDEQEGHN